MSKVNILQKLKLEKAWKEAISLVPRLPQNVNMYHRESLVSFLHKHDIIKIRLKQKGNVLRIV